ncbi:MAG: TetR/AcrR family transcriptional regulator, partial [Proteobacteria bacterium]|nr:TetR/AcrR family transcriptional regulator [Pseudomonadota bacterium]
PGKRDAILGAATTLFLEIGYGAMSMNMLVARVGGSKSTIYAHFFNKEKLFEAAIARLLDEFVPSAGNFDPTGLSLREGLTRIGRKLVENVVSHRHVALARMVIAEAPRFPEIGRIYYAHGPASTYQGLKQFLALHNGKAGLKFPTEFIAAEWFASRLLHRLLFRRLCNVDAAVTAARLGREVEETVDGFLRLFAAGRRGR